MSKAPVSSNHFIAAFLNCLLTVHYQILSLIPLFCSKSLFKVMPDDKGVITACTAHVKLVSVLLSQEASEAGLGPNCAAGHCAGERLAHLQAVRSGFLPP